MKLGDLLTEHNTLAAARAEHDARMAALPQSADAYQAVLPADFKLPEGWAINADDPAMAEWRKFCFEHKLSQDQFSAGIALDARQKLAQRDLVEQAVKKRDEALGQNGAVRINDLQQWMNSLAGEKTAQQLHSLLVTPEIVDFFEKTKTALSSQGVTSFNQTGRVENTSGVPEDFSKWSFEQQRAWQYANSPAQRGRAA